MPGALVGATLGSVLGRLAPWAGGFDEPHAFAVIDLVDAHADFFAGERWDPAPYDVSSDRKFAVPAVHDNEKMDGCGTPEVHQCIEGRASRSPGKDDIIDENHITPGEVDGNARFLDLRLIQAEADIIPVHRDIKHSNGQRHIVLCSNTLGKTPGQVHAARLHADERERLARIRLRVRELHDLLRHAVQRPPEITTRHKLSLDAIVRFHESGSKQEKGGAETGGCDSPCCVSPGAAHEALRDQLLQ